MDQPLRVIAVTRKAGSASFARRVLDYLPLLADRGIGVHVEELPRHFFEQRGFLRRLHAYDLIWWHRHLLHPLLLPRLPLLRPPILFDYDAPLICSASDPSQPSLARRLRLAAMLRRSRLALTASETLRALGLRYCRRVAVQPTPVAWPSQVRPLEQRRPGTLLWLGPSATSCPHETGAP